MMLSGLDIAVNTICFQRNAATTTSARKYQSGNNTTLTPLNVAMTAFKTRSNMSPQPASGNWVYLCHQNKIIRSFYGILSRSFLQPWFSRRNPAASSAWTRTHNLAAAHVSAISPFCVQADFFGHMPCLASGPGLAGSAQSPHPDLSINHIQFHPFADR